MQHPIYYVLTGIGLLLCARAVVLDIRKSRQKDLEWSQHVAGLVAGDRFEKARRL